MADPCGGDEFTKTRDLKVAESKSINSNEENENSHPLDTVKMCSPISFATNPKLKQTDQLNKSSSSTNQFILKSSSLLRPSQLNGNIGSSTSSQKHNFLLNPSKLNPFGKVLSDSKTELEKEPESTTQITHKFLPLIQNGNKSEGLKVTSTVASTSTITQTSNFVFGQNIQDRVVSDKQADELKSSNSSNSNGTSDMLFTSVLKENSKPDSGLMSQGTKTLSESAREYEESRAVKRKFEEVEVITGEEGEKNIVQITCKLFAFDTTTGGSWQERGRGNLRLNDQETEDGTQSRLVFRATGSHRVVLNTKIWAEMTIELASNKSIRFMAFDTSGEVKVFLLTGNPDDIKQLYKQLEVRLQKEINRQKCSKSKTSEPSCSSEDPALKKSDELSPGY